MFDWPFAASVLPKLAEGAALTLFLTFVTFVLSAIVGAVILLLQYSPWRLLAFGIAWYAKFIRSTPVLVLIFFFFFVLPDVGLLLTPFQTGIAALVVHNSCFMAEIYRSALENIPRGQWDASTALGLEGLDRYRFVIGPQMAPQLIPTMGNFLIYTFKDSPLVAVISAPDIMFMANDIASTTFRYVEPVTLVGLFFITVSVLTSVAIRLAEARYGRLWRFPGAPK